VLSYSLFGTMLSHSQVQNVLSNSSCYSDLIIFWDFVSHFSNSAIFTATLQSFFRFYQSFLDIVTCYNDSTIFTTETQPFFRFCQPFFEISSRAIVTQLFCYSAQLFLGFRQPFCYSGSVILRFCQSFFVISSAIFEISPFATMSQTFFLQWLSHFLISLGCVGVTKSFCDLSVILKIWSAIFSNFIRYF
jgi:hypothetical protein